MDRFVRALFEGQPNVETKALLGARSLLGRPHDPIAASGDHHPIEFDHAARKFPG